ncbi:MAG: sigma-70 family RNA polymerase sigma factor [Polyangiaceae bacterium]|nr:sigma-70 family RNA polymerase sigma factor [Polyangiaceae bacterium]
MTIEPDPQSLEDPTRRGEAASRPTQRSAHDEARLVEMLRSHHAAVWRTALRMGLNVAQADDATQQTFITAAARLHDIRPGAERAFLLGTAVRISKHHHGTAASRHELLIGLPDAVQDTPCADELLELKQARVLLGRALDALPEKMREVFVLFELEGLTLSEISELLAEPLGTVASRLRRGREHFFRAAEALRQTGEGK